MAWSTRSRKLTGRSPPSTSPCLRLVPDTGQSELRVAVRLLVEPTVLTDLLQFEALHRDGVVGASLDAQRAADAAFLVEHHGPALAPAVRVDELRQGALGLHLVDVDHVDDALGTDV